MSTLQIAKKQVGHEQDKKEILTYKKFDNVYHRKGYVCATQKNVFEVAVACPGYLVVPHTEKEEFGGACVAFFVIRLECIFQLSKNPALARAAWRDP